MGEEIRFTLCGLDLLVTSDQDHKCVCSSDSYCLLTYDEDIKCWELFTLYDGASSKQWVLTDVKRLVSTICMGVPMTVHKWLLLHKRRVLWTSKQTPLKD